MRAQFRRWLRPLLFVLGGMLVGYLYYRFIGCASGSCAITSNPVNSTLYMGLMGGVVSLAFSPKRDEG